MTRHVLHSSSYKATKVLKPTKHPVLHSRHPGETEDVAGDVTGVIHTAGPRYTRDSAGNVSTTTQAPKVHKSGSTSHPVKGGTSAEDAGGNVSTTTSGAKTKSHRATKVKTHLLIGEPGGGPMQGYIDMLKAEHRYGRKSTVAPRGYTLEEGPHGGRILVKKTTSSGKTHKTSTTHTTRTTKGHTAKHTTTSHSTSPGADSRNATPLPPGPITPTQARGIDHAGHVHPKSPPAPRVSPASATRTRTSLTTSTSNRHRP